MAESLLRTLFPPESRSFAGKRWVNIALRSLHLVGTAGAGAGMLFGVSPAQWQAYLWLTVITGVLMVALQLWSNGVWLLQLRGLAIGVKLLLLVAALRWPQSGPAMLIAVVLLSGVISHAPGDIRYHSPWHGRRLESLGGRG
ncbi:hypothetical protein [Sediminicurvatus halobius]|uniref:Uncharacterized protein n=1 Tax=Sediminicurvatus halobius TaxID=2182432 RepID=A0A2U2N5C6_9GAMM|nr:hypothetical protein [Spiribacter halobius]PWG64292.1 hypothetical protein DEM34_05245 [Spiribacter halobius]UEX79369.1 hypothetical protein LMH63_06935 [Spiribacter halobius]